MQRELILHIGLPKTGSTSIQTFLVQNRSALMRHAIDYLAPAGYFERGRPANIAKGNGRYFAQSLLPADDPMCLPPNDRFVAALRDAIEKCSAERVLLSSELFVFASEVGWSEVVDICERQGRKLRLIAAVRNHADIISSSLIELARSFGLADLSRERIRLFYAHHPALKYGSFFSALRRLAGDRIHVLSHDRAVADRSLMADFLGALEISHGDGTWAEPARLNVTPSPEAIAFIRLCNSRNVPASVSNAIARLYPAHRAWTLIDPACAREIKDFFAPDIEGLRAAFGLSDDFFAEPCTNYVDLGAVSFKKERLLRAMARVIAGCAVRGDEAA
jgi:hypothetical protein